MLGEYKLGATLPTFSSCADRYCLSGYGRGGTTMEEMLELASGVEELDGLELVGNWHVNDDNIKTIGEMLGDKGLEICMLVPDLWTQAKWGRGSLASPDRSTRLEAIDEVKKVMDWAYELGCPYVDVWPGQDGYDYPLQADYIESWKWLCDGLAECAQHQPKVKLLVEYKLKEPRTHCFVNSSARLLLLLERVPNVGGLLDVGHALAGQENMAESACLLASYGKLDYLHFNDNYRYWDDDMMPCSVHLIEYIELVYWLRRLNYEGWLTLDIFPYREDGVESATEGFAWLRGLFELVDKISNKIDKQLDSPEPTEISKILREALLGT